MVFAVARKLLHRQKTRHGLSREFKYIRVHDTSCNVTDIFRSTRQELTILESIKTKLREQQPNRPSVTKSAVTVDLRTVFRVKQLTLVGVCEVRITL